MHKDEASDSRSDGPAIAFVAARGKRLPSASRIAAAAARKRGGLLGKLLGRDSSGSREEWDDGKLILELPSGLVAISCTPVPIPWSSLEGPCETSWWWPEATERMSCHTRHFIVALLKSAAIDSVERRFLLTKIVAAVLEDSDAVGVYWSEGTLVHAPDSFSTVARSLDLRSAPLTLWVDVRVVPNGNGTHRCFTTGMAPLGFREIEALESSLKPEELHNFIGDMACYIVDNRLEIPDGDTMGRTATEKYRVRYAPSMFDRAEVMRLVMS